MYNGIVAGCDWDVYEGFFISVGKGKLEIASGKIQNKDDGSIKMISKDHIFLDTYVNYIFIDSYHECFELVRDLTEIEKDRYAFLAMVYMNKKKEIEKVETVLPTILAENDALKALENLHVRGKPFDGQMTKNDIDYAVIRNVISILAVMCASDKDMIIDKLTGYLWDEEESSKIKNSDGNWHVS